MNTRSRLSADDITAALADLPAWTMRDGRLHRELQFPSFPLAMSFMARVAESAEAMDHHPDWCNSYTRVVIDLSSHDVGGISGRDIRLARAIEDILTSDGT